MKRNALALLCGIAGGLVGFLGFRYLTREGFYALVLPGGLLGLFAGIVPTRSIAVPLLSALRPLTLGLIAFGGLVGFYVPFRRRIRNVAG